VPQDGLKAVPSLSGLPVEFEAIVFEIDEPVLGSAVAGVQRSLGGTIQRQREIGDLDDERGGGRVGLG